MQKFGWAYQRTGFNGTSNPGQSAVRRVLVGMGDYLPRGSKVYWQGEVDDVIVYLYGQGKLDQFKQLLQAHGYALVEGPQMRHLGFSMFGADQFQVYLTAVTPIDFSDAKDTFSDITGIAWSVWGQEPRNIVTAVTNVPYTDPNSGKTYYQGAPDVKPPPDSRVPDPDPCSGKKGLDYVACVLGFDKLASSWGLAAGAGATLALGAIIVTGLVILKK